MHLHHRHNEVCASKMHWTCCAGADQLTITLNISWAYWTHCVRDVHSKAIASGRCQSAVRVQCVSSGYVGNLIFLPYLEGNISACNSRTWEWSKKKKKSWDFSLVMLSPSCCFLLIFCSQNSRSCFVLGKLVIYIFM